MKRSKLLLISAILSTLYCIYLISYFSNGLSSSTGADAIASGLATAIVMPHMVCVVVAAIFNWLGFFFRGRWAALVAGILYAVSMLLMFIYAFFVLIQMVLCFVAFARMKRSN